ncbi:MAG: hypothetical protein A2073_03415 [Deltaproteobacteria bacterium GWC2_42_11]|nr:MAG: hypothetical protein A2073_03415 [Deltaproteobacteria bacterium GWC2_42_11]HBO84582.1 hypothetical protein [Deltaproteobacteria bacterium]
MARASKIIILGIGNILMRDDGFGIHIVNELLRRYKFPPHVTVIDGGTVSINLLPLIEDADHLIVIDVINSNNPPGTISVFKPDRLPEDIVYKRSLHQVGINEIFGIASILEKFPDTTIIGIQPSDINSCITGLTNELYRRVDEVVDIILKELGKLGVRLKI